MPIPMTQIPRNLLVPGMYNEIDNSLAGTQEDVKKVLLIGHKTAGSPAEPGKPIQVLNKAKAAEQTGHGSHLAIMAEAFLDINKTEECWLLPVAEPANGTAWRQSFAVESSGTEGTIDVVVNGREFTARCSNGAAPAETAAAIVARINGELGLPVEASVDADGAFTVTALVKGVTGNYNRVSFFSKATTITSGKAVTGTGTAAITEALAGLGEVRYRYMVSEFNDAANLAVLSGELESRYSALRQIGGRAFVALTGELGSATEAGSLLYQAAVVNSPHIVFIPRFDNPRLPCEWAARFAAAAVTHLAADPAANTYELKVDGITAAAVPDFDTRQKLLEYGISTWKRDARGNVLIERLVTSYTENADGARDTSYLDIQVPETVDAVRTCINAEAKKRFKSWKLASTEENFGGGARVMTAGVFRSFLADLYQNVFIQEKQWCQDFAAYKDSIEVEVKKDSKTRLEYRHEPNLIDQFLIGAGITQFR